MNRRFQYIALSFFIISTALFTSCDKNMSVALDKSEVYDLGVSIMDTISAEVSVLQMDDIPTSATKIALVGQAKNTTSGTVGSKFYTRLNIASLDKTLPEDASYDSIVLIVKPNGYYHGDTLANYALNVHRLTEPLALTAISSNDEMIERPVFLTQASIYNKTTFAYDEQPLGSKSFYPSVRSRDSVAVRLAPEFGKDLFDKMKSNDFALSSQENFNEYLPGYVLTGGSNNKAVIGFNDSLAMRIYYSYPDGNGFNISQFKSIPIDPLYNYNNISYDRSQTVFEALTFENKELTMAETQGQTYLEAGMGVVTKIKFPNLLPFITDESISVNKAELIIEVDGVQDKKFPISNRLMLFVANAQNIPIGTINSPFSNTAQYANYLPGSFTSNGKYAFDMIGYIKSLKTIPAYQEYSLFLTVPNEYLLNTVDRVILSTTNKAPKIKLNIIYTKF